MCVCVDRHPAGNSHASYRHPWLVRSTIICPPYLIHGTIIAKKKVIEHKMCFRFLYNLWLKHFSFSEVVSEIDEQCVFLSDINTTWIFSTDFRKILKIKSHKNPFTGSRVVAWGQMDGRTHRLEEANCRISRFCERAWPCKTKCNKNRTPSHMFCAWKQAAFKCNYIPTGTASCHIPVFWHVRKIKVYADRKTDTSAKLCRSVGILRKPYKQSELLSLTEIEGNKYSKHAQ
jgi:hypothetical protein